MPCSKPRPVSSVMGGLAVVGILVSTIFFLTSMLREKSPEAPERSSERGDCIYQVFLGEKQVGTARFTEPTRMSMIFSSLNISVPERLEKDDPFVPCNSALEASCADMDIPWRPVAAGTILTLGGKIDLNKAQEEDLMSVPGIGSGLARKIVDYRRRNGSFQSLEDLEKVPGVGTKTRKKLAKYVNISGYSAERSSQ